MNPGATILVSIATALATSIITLLLYTPKLKADLQKELTSRFNEQKWQTYTQFAELLPHALDYARGDSPAPELRRLVGEIGAQIIIVGSLGVMRTFTEWVGCLERKQPAEETFSELTAKLMSEMKKDLGYKPETGALNSLVTLLTE
jgi:hypothetical protein